MHFRTNQTSIGNQNQERKRNRARQIKNQKKVNGMLMIQLNTIEKGKELFRYIVDDGKEFAQKEGNCSCILNVFVNAYGQEAFFSF